ncbi:unnamed protein product [Closterium sp. NIES-54]
MKRAVAAGADVYAVDIAIVEEANQPSNFQKLLAAIRVIRVHSDAFRADQRTGNFSDKCVIIYLDDGARYFGAWSGNRPEETGHGKSVAPPDEHHGAAEFFGIRKLRASVRPRHGTLNCLRNRLTTKGGCFYVGVERACGLLYPEKCSLFTASTAHRRPTPPIRRSYRRKLSEVHW